MNSQPTPVSAPQRRRADPTRLEADRQLYADLAGTGFEGPGTELLLADLWRYGFDVVLAGMRTGTIYELCAMKGFGFTASEDEMEVLRRRADLRDEVAADCLHHAYQDFIAILQAEYWDPDKGATLRTFFVGTCLFAFRDAFRRWARPRRRYLQMIDSYAGFERTREQSTDTAWFEKAVILRETLDLILDGVSINARAVCKQMLSEPNATQDEIGQMLGKSRKSVERHLSRVRERAQRLAAAGVIIVPSVSSAVTR